MIPAPSAAARIAATPAASAPMKAKIPPTPSVATATQTATPTMNPIGNPLRTSTPSVRAGIIPGHAAAVYGESC
jgi:hypothetical protein